MTYATLLTLLFLTPQASGPTEEPVATLRWIPSPHDVHVRGTVPVPDNFDSLGAHWSLVHPSRSPIPVQLERVVRGPRGNTEVVEVLALVSKAEEPLRWANLTPSQQPARSAHLPAPHAQLPSPILLLARDATGTTHEAWIEPLAPGHVHMRTRKDGPIHRQDKHALVMRPRNEEGAVLPHLFGVHAYLGNWAGASFLTLDLRIHNGLISPDPEPEALEAPVGPLYFESLQLVLPKGWGAIADVEDPALGTLYEMDDRSFFPIVKRLEGDLLHVLPPGSRFHRRLVLYPADDETALKAGRAHLNGAGRAVCLPAPDNWSWSNPKTSRYFPQRELLPDLKQLSAPSASGPSHFLARLRLEDMEITRRIRRGSPGTGLFSSGAMGWAHPWFRPSAGGHGGEGVTFLEGLRALASGSPNEFRRLELLHRANCSRHPTAAWRADGESTHLEEWLNEDGELPFAYHLVAKAHHKALRLPCEGGPELHPLISARLRDGRRPPYDRSTAWERNGARPTQSTDILAWHPHDGAHLVRFTAHAKALAWLCNDSLAIDALLHEAERIRLALPTVPSRAKAHTTLHQLTAFAESHPSHGLPIGRELGWALDTTAAAFALGDPGIRARLYPWISTACRLIVQGTPPTGISIRNDHSPLTVPRTHATAHSFQTAILQLGIRSASRSCLRGVDGDLEKSLDELFLSCVETLFHSQVFYEGSDPGTVWPAQTKPSGPRWIFPVAPLDWGEPPISPGEPLPASGYDGGVEVHYAHTLLAWAHALDPPLPGQSPRHLNRILDLGPRYASWADWIEHLARRSRARPGLDPLSQAAPALLLAP